MPREYLSFSANLVHAQVLLEEPERTRTVLKACRSSCATAPTAPTLKPATVQITVRGPRSAIESLELDHGAVYIDATGLEPGSYEVTPAVDLPADVELVKQEPGYGRAARPARRNGRPMADKSDDGTAAAVRHRRHSRHRQRRADDLRDRACGSAAPSPTWSRRHPRRHKIIIGKDTRLSGYMLESALTSGICSMGVDVLLVGPLPTPGIAFLTRSMRADAGVVISASHNPFQDNGIKFFAQQRLQAARRARARDRAPGAGRRDRAPAADRRTRSARRSASTTRSAATTSS